MVPVWSGFLMQPETSHWQCSHMEKLSLFCTVSTQVWEALWNPYVEAALKNMVPPAPGPETAHLETSSDHPRTNKWPPETSNWCPSRSEECSWGALHQESRAHFIAWFSSILVCTPGMIHLKSAKEKWQENKLQNIGCVLLSFFQDFAASSTCICFYMWFLLIRICFLSSPYKY